MSSVDVRIVEMRFDNKEFESNIKTSMSTLDKFKEKLNLSGATGGLSGIEKAAKSLDLSGISKGVDAISDRFSNLGIAGMEVVKRLTNSAINFGKTAINKITDPIMGGGLRRAQNIESAHFLLQGLIDDEEKVQRIMNQASDSVNETAFSYDVAAKAAAQFTASGVKEGSELEGALRGLAGVAAVTGSEYEGVAHIFTTVAGQGKVTAEQFNQLSVRGLNAAADIARFMNGVNQGTIQVSDEVNKHIFELTDGYEVFEDDIREWTKKKLIDFELFSNAMSSLYGDHAKKANETVDGVSANIRAALARIGADFYSPLIVQNGPLVQTLEKVRLKINEIRKATGLLATNFVTPIAEKLITLGGNFVESLSVTPVYQMVTALNDLWRMINIPANKSGLLQVISNLADGFKNIWDNVKIVFGAIRDAFLETFPFFYSAEKGVLGFSEAFKKLTGDLKISDEEAVNVKNTFKGFFTIVKTLADILIKIGGILLKVLTPVFGTLGSLIVKVTGYFGDVIVKISQFTEKSRIFEYLGNVLKEVFGGLAQAVGMFSEKAKKVIGVIKKDESFTNFAESLGKAWETIKKMAGSTFDKAVTGIKNLAKHIKDASNNVSQFVEENKVLETIAGHIQTAIGWLVVKFQSFLETSRNVINTIKNSEGFQRLATQLENVWNVIEKLATGTFAEVVSKVREFVGLAENGIVGVNPIELFTNAVDKAAGKVADFIQKIQNGENPIKDFINNLKDFKFDFSFEDFRGFADNLFERFRSIGNNLDLTGVKNVLSNIKSQVKEFIDGIDYDQILKQLEDFITNVKNKIKEFFENLDLSEGFGAFKTSIETSTNNIFENVKVEEVVEQFKSFFSRVANLLSGVDWNQVFTAVKGITSFLILITMVRNVSKMMKATTGLLKSTTEFVEKAGGLFGEDGFFKSVAKGFNTSFSEGVKAIASGLKESKEIKQHWTTTLLKLAASVAIMVAAFKILSDIDPNDTQKAAIVLGGMMIVLTIFMAIANKIAGKDTQIDKVGKAMTGIGIGLLGIAAAAKILGGMDANELKQSAIAIGALMAVFLIASRKSRELKGAGLAFVGMAVAIDLLIPAMLAFAKMKWETILKGGSVIVSLAMFLALASRIAKGGGGLTLIGLAVAIDLLIPALLVMALLPVDKLAQAAIGLIVVMNALAISARIAGGSLKGAASMLALALSLDLMIPALLVLALLPIGSLMKACLGLVIVMTAIAASVRIATGQGKAAGAILSLALTLVVATGALIILANMPFEALLISVAALCAVLLSVGAAVKLANGIGLGQVVLMGLVIAAAVGALIVLENFTDYTKILTNAVALGVVLLALGASVAILSKSDEFKNIKTLLNTVALLAVLIGASIGALLLLDNFINGEGLLQKALSMGVVALAVATAARILSGVKEFSLIAAIKAIVAGELLFVSLGAIVVAIGALFEKHPDLENLMDRGFAVLTAFSEGIGAFLMGFITGAIEQATGSLETVADDLSTFMEHLQPFFGYLKEIDAANLKTLIGALAEGLLALTGAEILDSIVQWLQGKSTLEAFGQSLSAFGAYFSNFSMAIKSIPEGTYERAEEIAKVVERFAAIKIENQGGKLAEWLGDNTLSLFGQSLQSFGPLFYNYARSIKGVPEDTATKSEVVAQTIERLAAIKIENQGGLIAELVGDNTLGDFAGGLAKLGAMFSNYARSIKDLPEDTEMKSNIIAAIIERFSAIKLENQGGAIAALIGDNTLDRFGTSLSAFSETIVDYAKNIAQFPDNTITKSNNVANIIERFSAIKIGNHGGAISVFTGDDTMQRFGESLSAFSTSFNTYATNVGGINDNITTKSNNIANVVERFCGINIGNVGGVFTGPGLSDFGLTLSSFGGSFKSYYDQVKDVSGDTVVQVCNSISGTIEACKEMFAVNNSTITGFGTAIQTFGNNYKNWYGNVSTITYPAVLGVCNSIRQILMLFNEINETDLSAGNNFNTALTNMASNGVNGFCNAFTNSYWQVQSAISSLMYQASNQISGYYWTLYNAGLSAGRGASAGLSAGISAAAASAYAQAATVAANISSTVRRVLKINSPSKVMAEIGEGVDEGLALGINNATNLVETASSQTAKTTINAMSEALDKTSDLLNGTGETAPVITPVLDLSEIQNGANHIDGMFADQSVGLSGVNSGLFNANRVLQQTYNVENSNKNVVDEIARLRTDVGTLSDYIGKLRLVLDSGALVGGLIDPIDTELGKRQILAGRGV